MKWIGQHIYDLIARFRNDIYLEGISTSTETDMLVVDSNNKVSKRAIDAITVDVSDFMTNGADNYILTATGADAMNAEAKLQFDGSTLSVKAGLNTTQNALFINMDNATTGKGIYLDIDDAVTATKGQSLIDIDYDKAGVTADGATTAIQGQNIDMRDSATNHANSTVNLIGQKIFIDSASDQGANTNVGLDITAIDATTNVGIKSLVENGGTDIIMYSSADSNDYATISTGAAGAVTLKTVDSSSTRGYLNFDLDGGQTFWYANGNLDDYLNLTIGTNGDAKFTTVDDTLNGAHFEIEADGNITLDAAGNIALEAGGNNVTVDTDNFVIESATANSPVIKLLSTANDSTEGNLIFEKLRADDGVAQGQNLGAIWFRGQDSGQNTEDYAYIIGEIDVSGGGEESGQLVLGVANHDGGNGAGLILTGGSVDDEIDVTVGLGAASVTTVTGTLTMGSTTTLTNAGLLSVANQSNITGLGTISSGVWNGTAVASAYLDADTAHLSGTQTFGGAKTFSSAIVGQTTVQKWIKNVAYVATQGTTETFIPMVGSAENTSVGNGSMGMIMPTAGKLLKVHLKTQRDHSGVTTTVTMYNLDTDEAHTAGNFTSLGVQSATGPATAAVGVFDFQSSLDSGTNAFTAGEIIAISLTNDGAVSSSCKYFVTLVFELDWTSY